MRACSKAFALDVEAEEGWQVQLDIKFEEEKNTSKTPTEEKKREIAAFGRLLSKRKRGMQKNPWQRALLVDRKARPIFKIRFRPWPVP